MKKKYIKPEVMVANLEPISMCSSSTNVMGVYNQHAQEELSNDRRGTWGNLW